MSTPFPHRIRRLQWQARAPTTAAAFALRSVLRDAAEPVLAALAERLSAHSPDDRVVRLERLELQLQLGPALNADALPAQVAAAADEALAGLAWQHAVAPVAEGSPPVPTPDSSRGSNPTEMDESSPADTAPLLLAWLRNAPDELHDAVRTALAHVDEEAGHGHPLHTAILDLGGEPLPLPVPTLRELARRLDTPTTDNLQPSDAVSHDDTPDLPHTQVSAAAVHAQAGLTSYLRRGSPDWSLAGLPEEHLRTLLTEAALAWVSLGCLPPDIQALPRAERLGGLSRWLALLPAARRRQVVDAHAATVPQHPLSRALQALLAVTAQQDDGDSLHAQALWLAWTLEGEPAADEGPHPWRPVARAWLTALFATRSAEPHWRAILDLLEDTPPRPAMPARPTALADDKTADRASSAPAPSRITQTRLQDAEPAAAAPHFDQRPASTAPTGQLVPQAGLVLLHPYLPRLFEAVGLLPTGHRGPLPKAVLPRASALLHGLASGTAALEFELPFVKLLLGLPPDTPFSHTLPDLTEAERAEAEALLAAVLAHWQALRGTTADGLRTAFLRRRGHLRRQDETWQLRVEAESFDLLLGLLPWSISLVRLPWMPWPLLTEWGTQ